MLPGAGCGLRCAPQDPGTPWSLQVISQQSSPGRHNALLLFPLVRSPKEPRGPAAQILPLQISRSRPGVALKTTA